MLKAYKYRLYPTSEQANLMAKHFGCARHVYNWGLDLKQKHYEDTGKKLSYVDLGRHLTQYKQTVEWLREVNSQSLQASLRNLDTAYTNFFKKRAQFPKIKSKHNPWQSYQCPQYTKVDFAAGTMDFVKLKGIRAVLHRSFTGEVKTVTIKRSPSGKYFASVLVDNHMPLPAPMSIDPGKTLGIDLGLTHMAIDSEGHKIDNPKHQDKSQARLAVEQKKLARCKKGSNNRGAQRRRVAIVHEKVANQRMDFIHKTTAELVSKNHVTSYAVEDLNIKGMVKNHHMARAISGVGWGLFVHTLTYKCAWSGKSVLRVGQFTPTSKLCNSCGHKLEALPLQVRAWQCPICGTHHDRDINAARNIKNIALADTLGHSVCIKGTPAAKPIGVGAVAKGGASAAPRVARSPH